MPENKELMQYVNEHLARQGAMRQDMHYFPDIECMLSKNYLRHQQWIKDFEVFEDDIWVLSYPKCGTTWCQEMVWLVANNLNYKGAEVLLNTRYSFLEFSTFLNVAPLNGDQSTTVDAIFGQNSLKKAKDMPRPRFIKSHLPLALLPTQLFEKKAKVFLVMRDPRDSAVSYLHHYRLLIGYSGTAEKFYEAFLQGCFT